MKPLTATARLQFHRGFTLADAAGLVPYLASLGVSHIYASPLLRARSGSMHGYDIVDHNSINPELGGETALRDLMARLRAHGMGLILDIVPNHMGVGGSDNEWWLDVLEWGRASPYAEFFDIDWDPPDPSQRGRMLAPFLGAAYGECLAEGQVTLRFDPEDGRFFAAYFDHRFPITPRDYGSILLTEAGALEEVARAFNDLPTANREAMREQAEAARARLRSPDLAPAIAECLRGYDPASDSGRDRLHRLLERQNYRLAWWRAATDEINWRRFFDVNGLAGVRVEVPAVFEATHDKILSLYAEGLIDGVRIDHVDGLADPRGYCRKLRRRLDAAAEQRPPELRDQRAIIWVEKILAPHERLATDWLTDGTTGYDFMDEVSAVLHDAAGEAPITAVWTGLTGRPADFDEEAHAARRQILGENLSSELYATSVALHRIARRDLSTRDWTLTAVSRALTELLVHFHVYRIYAGPAGLSDTDQQAMDWALSGARRTVRSADRDLLELINIWLRGADLRSVRAGIRRQERLRAMVRFQQLSAPTAAKSVEDTAFYRFGRMLSRNEVGTEPSSFAATPASFHAECTERRRRFPDALLATATHDHKRGEDTRARLAVISEIPAEWETALTRWTRLNAGLRRDLDGPAPDAADEVMLYQTLVGAWPLALSPEDRHGLAAFAERVAAWMEKALREAKRHSGWAAPNAEYEQACRDFLTGVLDPDRPTRVVADIAAFAQRIAPAGALNSLSQTVLRLTTPGVPDLYQGAEFWDFSLVDPDNRRPVDFESRRASLSSAVSPVELLARWHDGHVKQAVIARTLSLRARSPALFARGGYTKLKVEGPAEAHCLAFCRSNDTELAIVAISRLATGAGISDTPIIHSSSWQETSIVIPRSHIGRRIRDVLSGSDTAGLSGRLPVVAVMAHLPVAVLEAR